MKVAVLTLGCRVNQSESSVISGTLRNHGVSIVGLEQRPDFCIINTCTVTGKSDANSRQLIRKAAKTGAKVIVTGCYSQLKRHEVLDLDNIFDIVPIDEKEKIADIILGRKEEPLYYLHDQARPYLKIQDGCNFSCSYCAVPYARGRSRSLAPDIAVHRAKELIAQGYHEIVITGIHLGSYGQDLPERSSLAKLVKSILKHTGICRVRLSSLEINEIDDELLEVLHDARVCRHLHLPLQSGSDNILNLMKRNYSSQTYIRKMVKIAGMLNGISIGSDIIVGFPGEEKNDFSLTYQIIDELPFSYLHIFPYSIRSGTAASLLKQRASHKVIKERVEALRLLSRAKKERYAFGQLQKILDVIIEEEEQQGFMTGTASNYLKIRVRAESICQGSMVYVRSDGIVGEMIEGIVVA